MRLVAGRDLERRRLDDEEALRLEPAAERRDDPAPRQKERAGGRGGGRWDQNGEGGGLDIGALRSRKSTGSRRQTR